MNSVEKHGNLQVLPTYVEEKGEHIPSTTHLNSTLSP